MSLARTGMLSAALLFLVSSTQASGAIFTSTSIRTTCPTPTNVGNYVSNAVVCDTGNVNSWIEFSNFTSTTANDLSIQGLANGANQGFYFPVNMTGPRTFQLAFDVDAVNTLISGINFHVTASGLPRTDASVTMSVCLDKPAGCPASEARVMTLGANSIQPYDTLMFPLASTVGVTFSGNVDAQAMLSQFETVIITATPEPATLSMFGVALLGVSLFRLRKRTT